MPRALPWNKLSLHWRLPAQYKTRELKAFFWGLILGVVGVVFPWQALFMNAADAAHQFLTLRSSRQALSAMTAEAKRLDLGYDQIVSSPEQFIGKFVVWCVDHPATNVSYLAGRPAQPLVWDYAQEVPLNSPTSGGRCTTVLATVEGVQREGVRLRYIGLP